MLLARQQNMRGRRDDPTKPRVPGGLDWQKHGLTPRWLGMETSGCSAALQPGFFASHGADERKRFLAGTRQRGELALVVAVIGDSENDQPRSVLSSYDSSIHVSDTFTSINGRRLPDATSPEVAPDLCPADRDLALRLLNRPPGSPWWSLHLSGAQLLRGDGSGSEVHEAEGQLYPILVDALGDPVAAAWTSEPGDQRWYIIPDATEWDSVLDWLTHRALPEFVPNALRRARSTHFIDPDLLTSDELEARQALDEAETRYAAEKMGLEQALREATGQAEPIRYGLLYGTGAELVHAVAAALKAAGLSTVDLDEELGATKSADLLVSDGSARCLIEVKSTSGAAPERLADDLRRHLTTWPQLRPNEPVAGGVLVVNHQHKLNPSERASDVYSRPEFVNALPFPVVSTARLFQWWRSEDWTAIRTAALGPDTHPGSPSSAPHDAPTEPEEPPTGRWRRGRRRHP